MEVCDSVSSLKHSKHTSVLDCVGAGNIADLEHKLHSVCTFVPCHLHPHLGLGNKAIVPGQPVGTTCTCTLR